MKKYLPAVLAFALLAPVLASAQLTSTQGLLKAVLDIVNLLIKIAGAAALLMFLWGMVRFIAAAGDPKAKAEGKSIMVWGTLALFVMVSIWGLVSFIAHDLNIDETGVITPGGAGIQAPNQAGQDQEWEVQYSCGDEEGEMPCR